MPLILQFGKNLFSSYPESHANPASAERNALKKALEELMRRFAGSSKENQYPVSDEFDVINRLPFIVERHAHGIWADQIELDYIKQYHETLPGHWLDLMKLISQFITVEKSLDDKVLLTAKKYEEVSLFKYIYL